jgi:hypothetical protein
VKLASPLLQSLVLGTVNFSRSILSHHLNRSHPGCCFVLGPQSPTDLALCPPFLPTSVSSYLLLHSGRILGRAVAICALRSSSLSTYCRQPHLLVSWGQAAVRSLGHRFISTARNLACQCCGMFHQSFFRFNVSFCLYLSYSASIHLLQFLCLSCNLSCSRMFAIPVKAACQCPHPSYWSHSAN